nr:TRAP transporter large permease subunit [Rhizobiaceae bacterium]
ELGIDLIWFGVLLGVNLQTSFLTPPFGFALFYLRSVAPAKAWFDKVSNRTIEPITTKAIYTGTLPFIIIQVIMLGLLIAFPGLVTHYKGDPVVIQPQTQQTLPGDNGGGLGLPPLQLSPPGAAPADNGGGIGLPPLNGLEPPANADGAAQPAAPVPAPGGLPALDGAPKF